MMLPARMIKSDTESDTNPIVGMTLLHIDFQRMRHYLYVLLCLVVIDEYKLFASNQKL
jgi:hypothetical protein